MEAAQVDGLHKKIAQGTNQSGPSVPEKAAKALLGWLRQHVHGKGSLLGFQDLLRAATGKPLDPSDFMDHLRARYLVN